ncbi:hypothetical protein PHLGIDRAFT_224924 [Phlebiopsis gigantea 11061_1 CR5-6]|uniref:Uncharacterized protein n=1 Tax=Phlebiopsis gigantea (strain 11061_1 CR5-6) TaxID=745531 RepID=A0A0C3PEF4_PHLG1|nr:hypothetical protein PHLGIDRAFT_224924 [Phlebiopsis gigantea 11061_1 CR5-6]
MLLVVRSQIVLSDAIVVWRVCVLWPRSKSVKIISVILVLATLVLTSLSARNVSCYSGLEVSTSQSVNATSPFYVENFYPVGEEFRDDYGKTSILISWATNVFATAAISHKAWLHRQAIRLNIVSLDRRTYAERVMLIFAESGAAYSLLWTLFAADQIIPPRITGHHLPINYHSLIGDLKASGLIHLIGMYPTFVIILVAFTKTFTEPSLTRVVDLSHVAPDALRNHSPPRMSMSLMETMNGTNASSIPISVIDIRPGIEFYDNSKPVDDFATVHPKDPLSLTHH